MNRISFMLKKVGSPTGNMKAKIYTGSVEGTGNQGSHKTVAATSTTTLDISTLTTSYAEVVFEFSLPGKKRFKSLPSVMYLLRRRYPGIFTIGIIRMVPATVVGSIGLSSPKIACDCK